MLLFLRKSIAYPWTVVDDNCFRGYFIVDGVLYEKKEAIEYLNNHYIENGFNEILHSLNGVFSFVLHFHGKVVFSVDRLRGLPLFYSIKDNKCLIGDDISKISDYLGNRVISQDSVSDMISSNTFVLGCYTLLEGIYQVRAGEQCIYDEYTNIITREQYYTTTHDDLYDDSDASLLKREFWKSYQHTGEDMIKALKGRTAVLPLSGGADSRMLLELLVNAGYDKIICYTYGKPGNEEARISKQVAEKNGCKWIFVPYSKKMWQSVKESPERIPYEDFASSYVSTPHFQDFPAVKYLKVNNLIPQDSVIIPGHSGDIPNGNHVASIYMKANVTKEDCLKSILNFTYHDTTKETLERIQRFYPIPDSGTPQDYATIEEWFDTAERQAKYIVNSCRVYEFFGYEWLIPLWDNNQLEFWSHISLNWRYRRKLYYELTKGDKLPSTNDPSISKSIAERIRHIPFVENIARRTRKFLNWYSSPLLMEHIIDRKDYLSACINEYPSFRVQTLICKRFLNRLK